MTWRTKIIIALFTCTAFLQSPHLLTSGSSASGIKILFSPKDECGKAILEHLGSARHAIELCIYHLTSRALSQALVEASRRGVRVRVYMDGENALDRYSKYSYLEKNGVLVKLENGNGLMHNKFCVIDETVMITGSYNWTTSADLLNDENVIFIESKDAIDAYRAQFERYWQGKYLDEAFYINRGTLKKAKTE